MLSMNFLMTQGYNQEGVLCICKDLLFSCWEWRGSLVLFSVSDYSLVIPVTSYTPSIPIIFYTIYI